MTPSSLVMQHNKEETVYVLDPCEAVVKMDRTDIWGTYPNRAPKEVTLKSAVLNMALNNIVTLSNEKLESTCVHVTMETETVLTILKSNFNKVQVKMTMDNALVKVKLGDTMDKNIDKTAIGMISNTAKTKVYLSNPMMKVASKQRAGDISSDYDVIQVSMNKIDDSVVVRNHKGVVVEANSGELQHRKVA